MDAPWTVTYQPSVADDLQWFGKKQARVLGRMIEERLVADPVTESKNLKILRPNSVARRELRLSGKYRVLFNIDESKHTVIVIAVGEKRGSTLIVQGEEYAAHHEDHSAN
jgi:mRNA-degrading endonuclease RelE of RelBE toxin-antitoxin system